MTTDKPPNIDEETVDLFGEFNADELAAKIATILQTSGDYSSIIPLVEEHNETIKSASEKLQTRFGYYSRLAYLGTVTHILLHDIRNHISVVSYFLTKVKDIFSSSTDSSIIGKHTRSVSSLKALDNLVGAFIPLASKNYRNREHETILEEQIIYCINLHAEHIEYLGVKTNVPKGKTRVAVHYADLCTILINLIANSLYWMREVSEDKRSLDLEVEIINENRGLVKVTDTGTGVAENDFESIFSSGVTKRPGALGMGLPVASEIVASYGGELKIIEEVEQGASFEFDIPLFENEAS